MMFVRLFLISVALVTSEWAVEEETLERFLSASGGPSTGPTTTPEPATSTTTTTTMDADHNETNATTTTIAPIPQVVVSMTLDVDDPAGFVADANSAPAVEAAIATASGVEDTAVHVILTVGQTIARRLLDIKRRLQSDYVQVDATIDVADAAAAASLETTVAAISPAQMASNITHQLELVNISVNVTVTSDIAVSTANVNPTPTPSPAPSGQASCASLRWRAYNLAPVFAVSAWLLSQA